MSVTYLKERIVDVRRTSTPRYGVTRAGYSKRSGAPTAVEVMLAGERRWRRVMVWQFSNAGTLFVQLRGVPHVLHPHDIDAVERSALRRKSSAWFSRGRDRRRSRSRR